MLFEPQLMQTDHLYKITNHEREDLIKGDQEILIEEDVLLIEDDQEILIEEDVLLIEDDRDTFGEKHKAPVMPPVYSSKRGRDQESTSS